MPGPRRGVELLSAFTRRARLQPSTRNDHGVLQGGMKNDERSGRFVQYRESECHGTTRGGETAASMM